MSKLKTENKKLIIKLNAEHIVRQNVEAENTRLHELVDSLVDEREQLFQSNVEKNGEVLRLLKENTRLRELVRDYERCSIHADCAMCEYDGTMSTHCPFSPCFPDSDELYELGVET